METKKLLITGFDPFGGESINPSWEAVNALPETVGAWKLTKLQVPTVFGKAGETVLAAAEKLQPDAILCVGQAGGRAAVTPELVAINLRYGRIADNAGVSPMDEPVVADGPAAYFSTLPVRDMIAAMKKVGVPASLSNTAGTFVCNNLMYGLLDYLHRTGRHIPAGFIHIPATPAQAVERPSPSLSPETVAKGLLAAISVL